VREHITLLDAGRSSEGEAKCLSSPMRRKDDQTEGEERLSILSGRSGGIDTGEKPKVVEICLEYQHCPPLRKRKAGVRHPRKVGGRRGKEEVCDSGPLVACAG